MFRRTGPPCCVVPSDSVVPANEDSRITGIAALTTAPPPSRRRRCLREMSIMRLGSRLGERRESHDQCDGGAVHDSSAVAGDGELIGTQGGEDAGGDVHGGRAGTVHGGGIEGGYGPRPEPADAETDG